MKAHNGMRPQDIVVLLKILSMEENWLNKDLSTTLFISNSEISESLNRSMIARLISPDKRTVFKNSLYDFIVHGLKFVFPAEPGIIRIGIPTAHSAPVLKDYFVVEADDQYIWPTSFGIAKGHSIAPLYPNQALAAMNDPLLYDKLALVDAIRVGKTRERNKAAELLNQLFKSTHALEYSQNQNR